MVYFYFLDLLTSFSFIVESIESDIEEFRYDCHTSRTVGYTVYFFFFFLIYYYSIFLVFLFVCFDFFFCTNDTNDDMLWKKNNTTLF